MIHAAYINTRFRSLVDVVKKKKKNPFHLYRVKVQVKFVDFVPWYGMTEKIC